MLGEINWCAFLQEVGRLETMVSDMTQSSSEAALTRNFQLALQDLQVNFGE